MKVEMKNLIRAMLATALLFLSFFFVPCTNTLPKPSCPSQPTTWTVGSGSNKVQLNPADYPVAARAQQTSIDIEFSQLYMQKRIRSSLEAPPQGNPNPDSGVFVGTVQLTEQGTGDQKVNLLTVQITPWQRSASGTPVSLQRSYRLKLKIVPYLITSSTVPDEQKRRALLQSTDTGAVLRFELVELYILVNQEPVSCSSSNYDLIDSKVLSGVYDSLAAQVPLVLPAKQVTSIADKLLNSSTKLVGINVGSDLRLKIGLQLDQGTPTTFDSSFAELSRFPSDDWGVRLDTAFVNAAISRTTTAKVTAVDPSNSVSSIAVQYNDHFNPSIDVTVMGTLNKCGTVHWTSNVHVTPLIRKRADGKSILVVPSTQTTTNDAGLIKGACVVLDKIIQSLVDPLGSSTAVISTGGVCAFPMAVPVEFDVSATDHFYATTVETDGIFYVAGRSTFMDQIVGQRPPVPSCP
jgi:hypothetical protein